jgi:DNA-3-methyladenine glycosylase I
VTVVRCTWARTPDAIEYHDAEWGRPLHDDRGLFEFLTLEGAQAGLSWETILRKRGAYRTAFLEFDPGRVARMNARDVEKLMRDPGIVRNRLKIDSTLQNARAFLEAQREFGSFDRFIWEFVGGKPIVNAWRRSSQIPASTPISEKMSKELRKRGFRFVGPTICYAFMQAVGMVNDHLVGCAFRGGGS